QKEAGNERLVEEDHQLVEGAVIRPEASQVATQLNTAQEGDSGEEKAIMSSFLSSSVKVCPYTRLWPAIASFWEPSFCEQLGGHRVRRYCDRRPLSTSRWLRR